VALIAEYTNQGKLLEYKIRNSVDNNLTPHLIAIDKNGTIWWTEGFVGMIGELNISQATPGTNNGVHEYVYPQICSGCSEHTSGIGVDTKGQIWFDDSLQSSFGSFPVSGTGTFSMYPTPTSGSHPHDGLMVDSQNRIWFDEEFANKLGRVITA
jgi:streptogramin lyase